MKKLKISLLIIFILPLFNLFKPTKASLEFCQNAKSAILFETNNNTVLYEKNINEKLPIASMTKVMTLSLVYDSIKASKLSYDDVLTTSSYAKSMGGSQVYLEEGEKSKLKDLIKCVCIASANDAAVTIAEAISGSEEAFVLEMNKKAKELNMNNTNYIDCTGLTDVNHYSTAFDMSIISSYLVTNHPEVLEFTSLKESYFREDTKEPFWLVNTNKLLGKYEAIDGLKTGWTNEAGYCISVTGKENNLRLVAVVMGEESPIVRNNEALELIRYGFSNYELKEFVSENFIYLKIYSIFYKNNYINIISKDKIEIVIKKNESDNYKINFIYNKSYNKLGLVEIIYNENIIHSSYLEYENQERRNMFELWIEVIRRMFS